MENLALIGESSTRRTHPYPIIIPAFPPFFNRKERTMRGPFLLAIFTLAALGNMAGALKGREVKILARGAWPHVPVAAPVFLPRQQLQWVIRSQDELARTAGKGSLVFVLNGFRVETIDFKKQMIVAIGDGTQPLVGISGGGPPSA